MKKILLIIITILGCISFSNAQENDFGIFNDVQITHTISKKIDFVSGVRFDTKQNTRNFAEQRIYSGFNFKFNKLTISPSVVFLKSFSKKPYFEMRPQVVIGYKFLNSKVVNITGRVRLEYHSKFNLRDDGRIVPILSIDKKISKNYSLFNTNEFWISINNKKDVAKYRKRFFFGVTRNINSHFAVDIFLLYQKDQVALPHNTFKLGWTWKIKL